MHNFEKHQTWLVTGAAGFIGSHIVEALLRGDQCVIGVDNFLTGNRSTIDLVSKMAGAASANFRFVEGDLRSKETCREIVRDVDVVLHLAALVSVPRSILEPDLAFDINVQGFNNIIEAARKAQVKRFVYSSSSAVYGDDTRLPKVEASTGVPLSPYASTKKINEMTADIYHRTYGFSAVGLRYFNVFGARQSPDGPYAAVIPQWIIRILAGESAVVYGDGSTTRDFCPVENVVAANLAAARADAEVGGRVFNIGLGQKTSLSELHGKILQELCAQNAKIAKPDLVFEDWRDGDIRHSVADISRAQDDLGYTVEVDVNAGLRETIKWFME